MSKNSIKQRKSPAAVKKIARIQPKGINKQDPNHKIKQTLQLKPKARTKIIAKAKGKPRAKHANIKARREKLIVIKKQNSNSNR
jgi:hypothetical protein